MAVQFRVFWLIVLCFFVSSCATYHPAVLPGECGSGDSPDDSGGKPLARGDKIRVSFHGGGTVVGYFVSCDETDLVIEEKNTAARPDANLDEEMVEAGSRASITISKIEAVELCDANSEGTAALTIVGVVLVAGAVALGIALKELGDSFD